MDQVFHIIALRQVKHSERHTILTAYSREAGRVAFAIPAGRGKEAMRLRALCMPLGLVECVGHMRAGSDVMRMSQSRSMLAMHGVLASPVKSALALFVAEVLETVVREGGPDAVLWDFVRSSVEVLNEIPSGGSANFHLCFLYGLGRIIGIEPDTSGYARGMVFDMVDGTFRLSAPLHRHYIESRQAEAVAALARMNYRNMHLFRMTRSERGELLEGVLRYYSLHHSSFARLKSLEVLRELF